MNNVPELSLSLADKLENTGLVEVNKPPAINSLQELANKGQEKQVEHGSQSLKFKDGTTRTVFSKSTTTTTSIFEPDVPRDLRKEITGAVFIHSHPILESEMVGDEKTLHIFPSEGGDFMASLMSKAAAGYLNVSSIHGLTMNIGVESMARDDDLTRRLRIKSGADEIGEETRIWKILSGEKAGSAIIDQQAEMIDEKFSMGDESIILASFTEYRYAGFEKTKRGTDMPSIGTIRNFLFLSWDKLRELEEKFGGLDNLFFGDGVDKLVDELNLDISHEKNLSIPCKESWKATKKRGE